VYSPGPATDVLTCAREQGFGNATLGGPSGGTPNEPPTTLLFGAAEVELNAASIVLTFAQKNGFPGSAYFGGNPPAAPEGITLPPPIVVWG
jgi:hypothetical protein